MEVVTYTTADEYPAGHYALARILLKGGFHPVLFTAETADAARAQAHAWWDAEIEKERRRIDATVRRVAARKAKTEADADV